MQTESFVPRHLSGRNLALHTIKSEASLRRVLEKWLREAPDHYYSHHRALEKVRAANSQPQAISVDGKTLDRLVANAAVEMIQIKQQNSPARFRDALAKARANWERDPDNHPGPDDDFGLVVPVVDLQQVKVTGTGSVAGDELAWVSALKLADAYVAAFKEERATAKDRQKWERHLKRQAHLKALIDGRSATPFRDQDGNVFTWEDLHGSRPKPKQKRARIRATVTPPSAHSSPSPSTPLPRWRDLSLEQKAGLMAQVIENDGHGLSVTINLSPKVVEDARSAKKGLASHLRDRFTSLLRRRLGYTPEVLIILEQGHGQKPHLHGVIGLEDTPHNRETVRRAGEVLSGEPLDGLDRGRIVDIKPLKNGAFWPGDYTQKFRHSTKRAFGTKRVMVHTRSLASRARLRHKASAIPSTY